MFGGSTPIFPHVLYQISPVHPPWHELQDSVHRPAPFQYFVAKKKSRCGRGILPGCLAAALLLLVVLRGELNHRAAITRLVLTRLARVQGLAGNNAVDF